MPPKDLNARMASIAEIIKGKAVPDPDRVEICIKGNILGFPATLEATGSGFPFGTNFFVETDVLKENVGQNPLYTITITPRFARGLSGVIGRLLMIDAREKPVGIPAFDNELLAHSNDPDICQRLIAYPGMAERMRDLQRYSNFREMHIQGKQGISLICPTSFKSLDYDVAREIFQVMGNMAQVLFDAF